MEDTLELALTFGSSAAIGLMVGLERERNPRAKAGLRTFALIAMLGSAAAMLADATDSGVIIGAALLAIGIAIAGAHLVDKETRPDDFGTTTVIAALLVFALGAINAFGHRLLAVSIGIGMTALLHFKVELEVAAHKLTPTDIRSMLQFGAVSIVILPLLPNEPYGPYGVLNPFHIWLMVVLISGVSLAGYVAWRLTLARKGLLLTGLLGGLVSSTATTLVYSRHARAATVAPAAALVVILLANMAMLARVLVIVGLVAVSALWSAVLVLGPALLVAAPLAFWRLRRAGTDTVGGGEYRNPTNLLAALGFGALYALILIVAAWLSERVGAQGVYGLAFVSGLTDVDAITLSSLRLLSAGAIDLRIAMIAVAIAVASNLLLKSVLVLVVGGGRLGRQIAAAFGPILLALAGGAWALTVTLP